MFRAKLKLGMSIKVISSDSLEVLIESINDFCGHGWELEHLTDNNTDFIEQTLMD